MWSNGVPRNHEGSQTAASWGQLLLRASPVPGKLPATAVAASCGLLGTTQLSLHWLSPLALRTYLGQMDQYFYSDFRWL